MRRPASHFLLAMLLVLPVSGVFATDDVTIMVSLNRDTIDMSEQAALEVMVVGTSQDIPQPRMPTLPKFEVYSQGRSSNVSIVNGVIESSVTYRYVLTPTKLGTYPIGPIAVVYKGKRYTGNDVNLTVVGKRKRINFKEEKRAVDKTGRSRDYFLDASVDHTNPYVNQQVTLTLKFYIAVRYHSSPELTEPATTGFWTELLGTKGAYNQVINNRRYRVIERTYALFPTQTGELTIGKASIRVTIASRRSGGRDPFDMFNGVFGRGTDVTIRSTPLTIDVKPLPRSNRPKDFTGTIGRFRIAASVDKRKVEVNQPVTVTVRLEGTGNIKAVAEPNFPELDDFRIYRASTNESISRNNDRLGGSKIYEEVFIPRRPGDLEIPAIAYNYFDPTSGQYKRLSTRPIKLKVTKPEGFVASPGAPYGAPDLTIGAGSRDLRFIKSELGSLRPSGQIVLFSPIYLAVNGIPVLALAAIVLVGRRRRNMNANVGLARSRLASKVARKRLARARSLLEQSSTEDYYAEIHLALVSYIADKLNISPHGLTNDTINSLLAGKGADQSLREDITGIMQQSDFARFAPASLSQEDRRKSLSDTENVMINLQGIKFD